MQAFCCCSSRRRGKSIGGRDDEAATSIPTSNPPGLTDNPLINQQTLQLRRPLVQADEVPGSAQVSPCEGPAELCQFVVDDDSDNEGDGSQSAKRSTRTLDVVRTKLIRHMSQDNETRRQSRMGIGHSEEELARRAELRRFRQKRIQDELDKEGGNDDSSNRSHRSTRYLSPLIDPGQPGNGPRDTIEFTVGDGNAAPDPCASAPDDTCESGQRRSSCHELAKPGEKSITSSPGRDNISPSPGVTSMTPVAHPPRPSTAQNMSAPRLAGVSSNPPRLDRVLGTDNDFDIRHGSHAWDDQSALGIWLIAQGMRSRENSLIRLGDPQSDKAAGQEWVRSPSHEFGGIDSVIDTPAPTQENSMAVSSHSQDTWANAKPSQSRPQPTESSHSGRRDLDMADVSKTCLTTSEPATAGQAMATNLKRPHDHASSDYPSLMPSFQPSPAYSTGNNYSLSPQDIENLELSPFQWHGNLSILRDFGHSEGQSSYATAEDDTSNAEKQYGTPASLKGPSQIGFDNKSVAQSETTSFQQREAELQTIEQRFGEVLARKKDGAPVHSRFKEEFTTATTRAPARTSFVTKLQSSISRLSRVGSYSLSSIDKRHSVSIEVGLKRLPDYERGGLNDAGSQSKLGDIGNASTKISRSLGGGKGRGGSKQTSLSTPDAARESYAETDVTEPQDRSGQPSQQWTNNMRQDTLEGPAETTTAACAKNTLVQVTPPESWAKYPSHNREARIQRANCDDFVDTQDFALKDFYSGEKKGQVTDIGDAINVPHDGQDSRPLPKRLEKAVRFGLSRLLPARISSHNPDMDLSRDDSGAPQVVKGIGQDTLEAAPGESRHGRIITVDQEMMTSQGQGQHLVRCHRGMASAISLATRQMGPLGNRDENSQSTTELVPSTDMREVSATPASGRALPDVFVTPLSRFYCDAATDIHTLGGRESIKSEAQAVVRRWQSTGARHGRNQRSSTWTDRSMTQPLRTVGSSVSRDGQRLSKSNEPSIRG
ncbi:Uncharacterized protein TPAR_08037 [Tolypocladium paradoxum]|uniref:Uncharacterized protein n=1 Tax=Tolypocladium paradoxum TaxID=94208 RepID=A0A2S4KNK5_9HYPO|nr:Uncharacterized protein TPAR_08037 [Tolypocladium paradoxum]